MLTSVPILPPRDSHTLWYTPTHFPAPAHTHSNPAAAAAAAPHDRPKKDKAAPARPSALRQLLADEAEIEKRKTNVARFGAVWIRPPGISKTFQAMVDEAAERAEHEALAAREAAAAEQQAAFEAQEAEARRLQMQQGARFGPGGVQGLGGVDGQDGDEAGWQDEEDDDDDDEMGMGERDLDDEVPDAGDVRFEAISSGEEEEDEEVDLDATDDGDIMEVSLSAVLQHCETNRNKEDRDLDDDVPEAGSYQHTDTEVEDESTDADFSSPARQQPSRPEHSSPFGLGPTVVQDFNQPSLATLPMPTFTSSPGHAESSMLVSSPGVPRARGGQGMRGGARRPPPEWAPRQPDFGDYGQP
ncbi:hypothetical protein FH972_026159 [Carpinus fangiana]|uniref:Uncharacterized protein n=1 Tax=Carpinus fangiana TaxID=176857 RepID=A0A5N6L353_9ROSI|nr:hypothetical protein FH972_026159 [Carpinus fangiana]